MTVANLAIVFGPTLLRPEGNPSSLLAVMDMSLQSRAVELIILNPQIFLMQEEDNTVGGLPVVKPLLKQRSANDVKPDLAAAPSSKSTLPASKPDRSMSDTSVRGMRSSESISLGEEFSQEFNEIMASTLYSGK